MTAIVQPDLYFSVPIDGYQDEPDGSVTVYGIPCKPDTLDVDGQRVDPGWLKGALNRWYQTGPNIREMHQPSAVGVGTDLDWDGETPYLTGKIVDPTAVTKVKNKVYRAFSIGVKNHVLKMNDPAAPKGWIVGGDIVETSVVDRPAIPGSDILDFKGDLFKLATAVGPNEVLDHQNGVVWQRIGDVSQLVQGDDMSAKSAKSDKEDKVAESTDKTAADDAEKTVDAATDVKAADGDEVKEADAEVKDAEADAGKEAEAEKTAETKSPVLAALEEKAAKSAFCVECGKSVEIENGKQVEQAGNTFLVGKDAAGHALRKFVPAADVAKRDPVPTDDDEDDECDMPDDGKAAKKEEPPPAPEVHVHLHEDDGDDEDEEDGKAAKVAAPASSDQSDIVKAALASLLADAGIDLGKIGRRMAKSRLDRFNAAADELKSIAAELGETPADAEKAAQTGSDAITRMQACLAEIASLARQMANPGSETEDTEDGPTDMGRAGGLNASTLPLARAADPDLTKKDPAASAQETAEVLAKAVAAELEKATGPLVERLAKVEYTLQPASPPVLHAEERPNAFVGKQADARRMAVDTAIGELTTKLSDSDREKLAAAVLVGDSSWQR